MDAEVRLALLAVGKLAEIGEALLSKFLAEEARKFEQIFAVEAKFPIGAPLVGTLDLVALIQGKKTLVEFKTGVNDWGSTMGSSPTSSPSTA